VLIDCDGRYLHLLLFAKSVIRGGGVGGGGGGERDDDWGDDENGGNGADGDGEGDDDDKDAAAAVDEGWTLQKTVQHYRTEANDEAALVFDGQSTRWQVKNQATLVATNLLSRFEEDGVTFDVVGARSAFTGSSSSKDAPPKTYLALHVEELVAAACTSSTFTSGEDLVPLQTNGLALLTLLLRKFKSAKDPDRCVPRRANRAREAVAVEMGGGRRANPTFVLRSRAASRPTPRRPCCRPSRRRSRPR
jgi:hypothetical protein